jgi:hypothetical protein
MGMDVQAAYTQYFVPWVERPNLLVAQNPPLRWNFASGALV